MKIELLNAEEILAKYKNHTDHWADQEWDDEGVHAAMQEYGELCAKYAANSIRYQVIERLQQDDIVSLDIFKEELIKEIQNLEP